MVVYQSTWNLTGVVFDAAINIYFIQYCICKKLCFHETKSRMMMIYGCPFQLSNCKDHGAADAKPHGNTDLQIQLCCNINFNCT